MAVETLKFAVSPDITLTADRHGSAEGAPALLLHGGGQTRWSWDATARSLSTQAPDRLTVYSVDMRGHGQSGWCRNGNYRVDAFADDLRAVVTQLGVPPVIVGASLGGLAALLGLCALFGHRFTVATTTASVSGVVQSGWPSRRSIFVNRTGNILRSPLQKGRHDGRP